MTKALLWSVVFPIHRSPLPRFRLPTRCQNVGSVPNARHSLHFHAVALYGPKCFYIPSTCVEQHSLTCTCTHAKARILILGEEPLGCLSTPMPSPPSLRCSTRLPPVAVRRFVLSSTPMINRPRCTGCHPCCPSWGGDILNPIAVGPTPQCAVDGASGIHQHPWWGRCQPSNGTLEPILCTFGGTRHLL